MVALTRHKTCNTLSSFIDVSGRIQYCRGLLYLQLNLAICAYSKTSLTGYNPCTQSGKLCFCSPSWPSHSHSAASGSFAHLMGSLVVSNISPFDALFFLMMSQQLDAFRSQGTTVGRSV